MLPHSSTTPHIMQTSARGPEGKQRYCFTLSLVSAIDGGVNASPRPLYLGKEIRDPLYRRLGGPQGRSGRVHKISTPSEFDPRSVQSVVSRYTDWTIPGQPRIKFNTEISGGMGWRSWLRPCDTSLKVAGSFPDEVPGLFYLLNPFGRNMALESTQPLTEMSTKSISWEVKAAGALGWQSCHLHVPTV